MAQAVAHIFEQQLYVGLVLIAGFRRRYTASGGSDYLINIKVYSIIIFLSLDL